MAAHVMGYEAGTKFRKVGLSSGAARLSVNTRFWSFVLGGFNAEIFALIMGLHYSQP